MLTIAYGGSERNWRSSSCMHRITRGGDCGVMGFQNQNKGGAEEEVEVETVEVEVEVEVEGGGWRVEPVLGFIILSLG